MLRSAKVSRRRDPQLPPTDSVRHTHTHTHETHPQQHTHTNKTHTHSSKNTRTQTKTRLHHLHAQGELRIFQDANYNTLRVWGGGLYYHDIVYDTADEMGLLMYHDVSGTVTPTQLSSSSCPSCPLNPPHLGPHSPQHSTTLPKYVLHLCRPCMANRGSVEILAWRSTTRCRRTSYGTRSVEPGGCTASGGFSTATMLIQSARSSAGWPLTRASSYGTRAMSAVAKGPGAASSHRPWRMKTPLARSGERRSVFPVFSSFPFIDD